MKKLYAIGVMFLCFYFASYPVIIDAAMVNGQWQVDKEFETSYNGGANLAKTILNSVDPNIFVNAINRLSDYVQRNGGVKALQTEEYNRMFVDEIQSAVQEAAQSLDQNTLAKVEKDPFFKQLANSADKSENFKKIAQNAQNVTPAQLVSTLTDMTKEVLQIAGGATGSATGGATGGALGAIAGALGGILPGIINVILGGISSLLGGVGGSLGGGTLGTIGGGLGGTVGGGILGTIGGGTLGSAGGTIGGFTITELANWLGRFLGVLIQDFNATPIFTDFGIHNLWPILGAGAYGAVSAFAVNTLALYISNMMSDPLSSVIGGPVFMFITGAVALFGGAIAGLVGGFAGLFAGFLGEIIMHLVNFLETAVVPIPYFDHTFWTIGGTGIVTAVAVLAEGIFGLLAGGVFGIISLSGPAFITVPQGAILGACLGILAGIIVGGGVGLIALSNA